MRDPPIPSRGSDSGILGTIRKEFIVILVAVGIVGLGIGVGLGVSFTDVPLHAATAIPPKPFPLWSANHSAAATGAAATAANLARKIAPSDTQDQPQSQPQSQPQPETNPSPPPEEPRVERLVVSVSTMVGRSQHVAFTVSSLMYGKRPPDHVYIWVALKVLRLNIDQSKDGIPEEIMLAERAFPGKVTIQEPKADYGPSTKLLGVLDFEKDPETVIITVDDDCFYHPETVSALEKEALKRPDHVIARSCEVPDPGDVAHGHGCGGEGCVCNGYMSAFASVAYRRKFVDASFLNYTGAPEGCTYHDDVWLGAHLWLREAPLWLVGRDVSNSVVIHSPWTSLSIHSVHDGRGHQKKCLEFFDWFQSKSLKEQQALHNVKPWTTEVPQVTS